jgi:uncharacterized phage protein (predicted DNA packaging)
MLTLQEAKEFLRVEHEDEDLLLSSLLMASEKYIINATRTDVDRNSDLFLLAQRFLVAHWFENRNTVVVGSVSKNLEFALESILTQLIYDGSVNPSGDIELLDAGEF